jgi:hypothetical protein
MQARAGDSQVAAARHLEYLLTSLSMVATAPTLEKGRSQKGGVGSRPRGTWVPSAVRAAEEMLGRTPPLA